MDEDWTKTPADKEKDKEREAKEATKSENFQEIVSHLSHIGLFAKTGGALKDPREKHNFDSHFCMANARLQALGMDLDSLRKVSAGGEQMPEKPVEDAPKAKSLYQRISLLRIPSLYCGL